MKYYTIILLFIVFSATISGQTFYPYPQPGLIQGEIYSGNYYAPGPFNATIKHVKDTVISSLTYSMFSSKYFPNYYTRYDNGKIFRAYVNWDGSISSEELLYDFTLGVGDIFVTTNYPYSNLMVDSVSTITLLNGQSRKYMHLTDIYSNLPFQWVDGIGDIDRGFLYASDFEGGNEQLICSKDSSGTLYINSAVPLDCDSLSSYSITSSLKKITSSNASIKIYPNPSNGNILLNAIINSNDIGLFKIYDLTGKLLEEHELNTNNNELQLSTNLNNGIYLYQVIVNDRTVKNDKLVIIK